MHFLSVLCLDQEGPGAVWAAETEDGGGGGGTQWVGENHPVEDPQTGAPQTEQGGQEVHHEPQGHAQNPGKNKQLKNVFLILQIYSLDDYQLILSQSSVHLLDTAVSAI